MFFLDCLRHHFISQYFCFLHFLFFLSILMVIISLELTRVNPDRNIFSINVELTSTFLLYRGLVHHHHWILNLNYIFLIAHHSPVDIRCNLSFQFCQEYLTQQLIEGSASNIYSLDQYFYRLEKWKSLLHKRGLKILRIYCQNSPLIMTNGIRKVRILIQGLQSFCLYPGFTEFLSLSKVYRVLVSIQGLQKSCLYPGLHVAFSGPRFITYRVTFFLSLPLW